MHHTIQKPKLSYYAHQILQTLPHMNPQFICSNLQSIFHNLKISEASQLFFSQSWSETVLKIHFCLFNSDLSQKALKVLSLPGHSADHGLSEYICKSLGEFGDKYELTTFFFCKITFFFFDRHFPMERLRESCKNINK